MVKPRLEVKRIAKPVKKQVQIPRGQTSLFGGIVSAGLSAAGVGPRHFRELRGFNPRNLRRAPSQLVAERRLQSRTPARPGVRTAKDIRRKMKRTPEARKFKTRKALAK